MNEAHRMVDLLALLPPELLNDFGTLGLLERFYIPTRYPDALPGTLPEGLPGERDAREALDMARQTLKLIRRAS